MGRKRAINNLSTDDANIIFNWHLAEQHRNQPIAAKNREERRYVQRQLQNPPDLVKRTLARNFLRSRKQTPHDCIMAILKEREKFPSTQSF